MIKINLAPADELESRFWYLPEVITAALVLLISISAVDYYLNTIRDEIQLLQAEKATLDENLATIKQETARFDQLDADIQKLKVKLDSLKDITSEKMTKYKQIVVIEHLLNLKPDGMWFSYVGENSELDQVTVVGKAFDNILIAEFMAAINSTKLQEPDPTDLRTQIYFSDMRLERVSIGGQSGSVPAETGGVEEKLVMESADSYWTMDDAIFPELKGYPTFQLTLKYSAKETEKNESISH